MKVVVFADVHFGYPNSEVAKRVKEGFLKVVEENEDCDIFVAVGDFFHSSHPVFGGFLDAFGCVMDKIIGKKQIIFLAGNHDFRLPSALQVFSFLGCKVIFQEEVLEIGGRRCVFLPFPETKPKNSGDVLFCHGPYAAFAEYKFIRQKDKVDFDSKSYQIVFLGDLHKNQRLGNIFVPGGVTNLSKVDVPGYFLWDTSTMKVEERLLPRFVVAEEPDEEKFEQSLVKFTLAPVRSDLRDFLHFWSVYCKRLKVDEEVYKRGVELCS